MGEPAGCPGAPVGGKKAGILTGVLEAQCATLRSRPHRSGLWTGSYPKVRRRHGQPALTVPPPAPARQHACQPHGGSDPRPPRPAPWQFSRPRRPFPPDVPACGISVGRADALLSLLTMVRNRAVASATLGPLGETASGCGARSGRGVKGPPGRLLTVTIASDGGWVFS